MNQPVVYDKAKYHYEGEYPEDLLDSQAFVHTGMYVGWLLDHEMILDEFLEFSEKSIAKFRKRKLSPVSIYQEWDGCLIDDMLTPAGNEFSSYYFDLETGRYFRDYEALLARDLPTLYHPKFTWDAYDRVCEMIDARYAEWKKKKTKSWWEFWK